MAAKAGRPWEQGAIPKKCLSFATVVLDTPRRRPISWSFKPSPPVPSRHAGAPRVGSGVRRRRATPFGGPGHFAVCCAIIDPSVGAARDVIRPLTALTATPEPSSKSTSRTQCGSDLAAFGRGRDARGSSAGAQRCSDRRTRLRLPRFGTLLLRRSRARLVPPWGWLSRSTANWVKSLSIESTKCSLCSPTNTAAHADADPGFVVGRHQGGSPRAAVDDARGYRGKHRSMGAGLGVSGSTRGQVEPDEEEVEEVREGARSNIVIHSLDGLMVADAVGSVASEFIDMGGLPRTFWLELLEAARVSTQIRSFWKRSRLVSASSGDVKFGRTERGCTARSLPTPKVDLLLHCTVIRISGRRRSQLSSETDVSGSDM